MLWSSEPDQSCATSSAHPVLLNFRCKDARLPCYAAHKQSNASTSGFSRDDPPADQTRPRFSLKRNHVARPPHSTTLPPLQKCCQFRAAPSGLQVAFSFLSGSAVLVFFRVMIGGPIKRDHVFHCRWNHVASKTRSQGRKAFVERTRPKLCDLKRSSGCAELPM